jgi:hypothetical protein
MFIYFSGDSFTAGDELADFMLPNWPGYFSDSDEHAKKQGRSWAAKHRLKAIYSQPREQLNQFFIEQQKRVWPTLLAKKLGADYLVSGKGGSSQGDTNYRTMLDIERLIGEGKKIDHVFIQVTEPYRIEIFNKYQDTYYTNNAISSLLACLADVYTNYNEKEFTKRWLLIEDDTGKIARFLTNIIFIRNYVKSKLHYEPIFVDSMFMTEFTKKIKALEPSQIIQTGELNTLIKTSGVIDPTTLEHTLPSMRSFVNPHRNHMAPNGHVAPEVHEVFAEHLFQHFFQK